MSEVNLPSSPSALREVLGEGFVRNFSRNLEKVGVDVVRIPGLSTGYSFVVRGRPVVVVQTTGNWFYTNWTIAHEVGHLALGHPEATPDKNDIGRLEAQANAFAADLLLPEEIMRQIDWANPDLFQVGKLLWDTGVSTKALGSRLESLRLPVSSDLWEELESTTQGFLRRHGGVPTKDAITRRMTESSERRFPEWLKRAHLEKIAEGRLAKGTLAWMLDVDEEELEVDEPLPEEFPDSEADLAVFME